LEGFVLNANALEHAAPAVEQVAQRGLSAIESALSASDASLFVRMVRDAGLRIDTKADVIATPFRNGIEITPANGSHVFRVGLSQSTPFGQVNLDGTAKSLILDRGSGLTGPSLDIVHPNNVFGPKIDSTTARAGVSDYASIIHVRPEMNRVLISGGSVVHPGFRTIAPGEMLTSKDMEFSRFPFLMEASRATRDAEIGSGYKLSFHNAEFDVAGTKHWDVIQIKTKPAGNGVMATIDTNPTRPSHRNRIYELHISDAGTTA
jgi:hypothetical protein